MFFAKNLFHRLFLSPIFYQTCPHLYIIRLETDKKHHLKLQLNTYGEFCQPEITLTYLTYSSRHTFLTVFIYKIITLYLQVWLCGYHASNVCILEIKQYR